MNIRNLLFVLSIFASCTITLSAQSKPLLLSLVEKSIPEREPGWKLTSSQQEGNDVVFPTGRFEWTNDKDKISARVTAYKAETAVEVFGYDLRAKGNRSIDGIGDAAVIDPSAETSKVPTFIVRFRKGGVVVSVLSSSETLVAKMARYIADAIPTGEGYSKLVPIPSSDGDFCHVYVVDVEKAQKANNENSNKNGKSTNDIETVFPAFRTDIGEETLTTKTYPFPNSKLIITASVYYTDESMASKRGVDSMLLGIVVSSTAKEDALSADDNAFSEATFFERDTTRVKKYMKVNGRRYLVGIQCKSNGHNSLP